jgi:hypothetical protein
VQDDAFTGNDVGYHSGIWSLALGFIQTHTYRENTMTITKLVPGDSKIRSLLKSLTIVIGVSFFALGSALTQASNVIMSAPLSYSVNYPSVNLRVANIGNYSAGIGYSGTLALTLWYTRYPYSGGTINGYKVAEGQLFFPSYAGAPANQLANGAYLYDVLLTTPYLAPPTGTYYVTLALSEYQGAGYLIDDYSTFSDTVTVGVPIPPTPPPTQPPTPTPTITLAGGVADINGTPLCAMALASGKYQFTCGNNGLPLGQFFLTGLPREADGSIKLQVYVDGLKPYTVRYSSSSLSANVTMVRAGTCPDYFTDSSPANEPSEAGKFVTISGNVGVSTNGAPVCAMVLANGQYMFSCDGSGAYTLNAPLDSKGQIKLQIYADGFAPFTTRFDRTSTYNYVPLTKASECY